ncbi:unnamed protein product [marine sediment metagenome]|uniref:Uncharacterized protein n=1 Tax=marine sediment metagenome TaxID=412755 RepID=X1QDR8_9ZZZZ
MDILCTRCGEPWDICSLTDDMSKEEAEKLKAGKGCPCCINKELCNKDIACHQCLEVIVDKPYCKLGLLKPRADDARYIQHELASILGDDVDGLSAMMEDAGLI